MSVASTPRPPPPKPKPGTVKVVRALYNYTAQYPDELSFEEGDMLYILDQITDPSWWKARCGKETGLIPSNYVESNTASVDCPVHDAAKRGNMNFLQECLQNGVSPTGLDKAGCTPLHWASHSGHTDCVMELLRIAPSTVNVQNKLGDTPLHSAAWRGHADVVDLLVLHGASVDIRNNEGKIPADLSTNDAVAGLLLRRIYLSRRSGSVSHDPNEYIAEDDEDSD